jgi:glycerophosphoryl diester phosphodiesterase
VTPRLVIGHRGASGYLPEHTLASYALAILQGADFIEPYLVATRDGVLVARHENEVGGTTDVATRAEFTARRRLQVVDGERVEGWFVEDFTLEELKSLRTRERIPELRPSNATHDGQFEIPTFDEILALLAAVNAARSIAGQAPVGVYPETKHPSHFAALGLPLEPPLLAALERGLQGAPLFIQSFETTNLQQLRATCGYPLTQLLGSQAALVERGGLGSIVRYAQAIGVPKSMVMTEGAGAVPGAMLVPTTLVRDAHAVGLAVHGWTYRAENAFLPPALRRGVDPAAHGDLAAEVAQHLAAGIDGLFCDQPDIVRAVVDGAVPSGV